MTGVLKIPISGVRVVPPVTCAVTGLEPPPPQLPAVLMVSDWEGACGIATPRSLFSQSGDVASYESASNA